MSVQDYLTLTYDDMARLVEHVEVRVEAHRVHHASELTFTQDWIVLVEELRLHHADVGLDAASSDLRSALVSVSAGCLTNRARNVSVSSRCSFGCIWPSASAPSIRFYNARRVGSAGRTTMSTTSGRRRQLGPTPRRCATSAGARESSRARAYKTALDPRSKASGHSSATG